MLSKYYDVSFAYEKVALDAKSEETTGTNQSYEIKLPHQDFLGFKILEIFSVEN